MKTLFIATVGIGTGPEVDITKPLIKSIREANPDFLLLFASAGSKPNAETIITELKRDTSNSEICVLSDILDIQIIFKEMNDKLDELWQKEFNPSEAIVDFTTGTKPMSSALVLTAMKYNCARLKYIAVKRNENRIAVNGTERTRTFEPNEILATYSIQSAINEIEKYRFESALELLNKINIGLLTDNEKSLVENLKNIAQAYNYWDKFDHIKFNTTYKNACFDHPALKQFKITDETKSKVHIIGEQIKKNQISEATIADLINNAKRRYEENKYDDAVARLYRTMEMLAQWRLKVKYKQDSDDIKLDRLPPKTIDWISRYRENDKIKIGLQKCYQLLEELSDELGKEFRNDDTLKALLKERNESILAHSTKPISKQVCEKLLGIVITYCKNYIDKFEELTKTLTFPWSK